MQQSAFGLIMQSLTAPAAELQEAEFELHLSADDISGIADGIFNRIKETRAQNVGNGWDNFFK